ncbi:flagellar basal body L-ring protein FlgH [Chitinimonas arctica]|uniref:Flagellar L-ring protein n=1 Tax=Chitinimonas arctica TaxID=2594795 RepID=A0A516SL20_9NEIS|nr:flagellar basal body L-ring protein FlgH [Chitinimonas arctica]QDQ28849.1 flagellar basal body L-ring protein FlgH [Chitinimonas arctica]
MNRHLLVVSLLVLLSACASVPPTIVSQPTSVRPVAQAPVRPSNGSIYQLASARPLFEDRLARHLGDNITIQIEEQINATSKSGNKAERSTDNSTKVSATANSPLFSGALRGLNLGVSSSNSHDGTGETSASNTFNGQITVQVVDVLANGNLVVAGEKQVNIRGEISYLRVSGIVNPADIKAGNMVSSNRIAEARIEEMGSGTVASADRAGWLQRFFFSFLPF